MGVLTDIPCNKVITDKSKFVINPAYDTVLEVQKLYKEDTLTEFEKIDQALKMLVRNKWNLRLLNPEEKQKLLSVITKRYVEVEKRPQIKKSPFPVLDFEKDGDYIYASFMQAYKIDLIEEQGRLPWKKFLYLFNGLPADTKIKQIMRIRQMPVPEYNGKNSKEIQEINEMLLRSSGRRRRRTVWIRSIVPYIGRNGKEMIADGKKIKKVECPHCGHKQNIFYKTGASCRGLFFKCKNPDCRKEFEIRL